MFIGYSAWIVNYHKDWKGMKPQVWRKEFGPVLTERYFPSASLWLVPGTYEEDDAKTTHHSRSRQSRNEYR